MKRILILLAIGFSSGLFAQGCPQFKPMEIDSMGNHFEKIPVSMRVEMKPDTISFFLGLRSKIPLLRFVVKSCEPARDAHNAVSGILYHTYDAEEGESKPATIHYRSSAYVEILYPGTESRVLTLKKE